jgi:thioredoxin-like negative regulator of GroEL
VNVDVAPDAAREFEVTSIPQTNFIVDGQEKTKMLGCDY